MLTITHDIKAPAGSIIGYIDLLLRLVHDQRQQFYLRNMQGSARHLLELVTSLLDYHRLEAGKMDLHPVAFNPYELFEHIYTSFLPIAGKKQLELIFHTDLPHDLNVEGDPFRIRQIAENLLSNALKFTEKGNITLYATYKESHFRFQVSDTGCGMNAQEQARVFQAFTRLRSAQGQEGFGLGLSITKKISRTPERKHPHRKHPRNRKHILRLHAAPASQNHRRTSRRNNPHARQAMAHPAHRRRPHPADTERNHAARHVRPPPGKPCARRPLLHTARRTVQAPPLRTRRPDSDRHTNARHERLRTAESHPEARHTASTKRARHSHYRTKRHERSRFPATRFRRMPLQAVQPGRTMPNMPANPAIEMERHRSSPKAEAPAPPVSKKFNFAPLTAFSENDAEAAHQIIRTFIEETRKNRCRIEKAVQEQSMQELGETAHKMLPHLHPDRSPRSAPLPPMAGSTPDSYSMGRGSGTTCPKRTTLHGGNAERGGRNRKASINT